ncbi:hypothetical protein [Botryobacter ruber]|uniref:hypothetical protein n=1 Tax=Botryobacter ruber TaxID=2171629 RepID=UPI000F64D6E6|nr:hypothetical protein [Botryobacter ruber]
MTIKLLSTCFSTTNGGRKVYFIMLLLLLLSSACARRDTLRDENTSDPVADPGMVGESTPAPPVYDGVLLGQIVFDTVDYIVPREQLLQPFIREFGDGTVVDRVMIHKVQEDKKVKPAYYLVGMGLFNGSSRIMALELDVAKDNSLYLSTRSMKYICKGSAGCSFCVFTFKGNKIVSCVCDSGSSQNICKQEISESNSLLRGVKLKQSRQLGTY